MKPSREQIISSFPLLDALRKAGCEFTPSGNEFRTRCINPAHEDKHPSMYVNPQKNVFICRSCGVGGSVVDALMLLKNVSNKDALRMLGERITKAETKTSTGKTGRHKVVASYQYRDETGKTLYFVDRLEHPSEKKRFVQYTKDSTGMVQNGINNVRRVLYRLPEIIGEDEVMLVEGEKCVHALESMGWPATTNPGGSNGWIPALADSLRGKHITIMPDADDEASHDSVWTNAVTESLRGKVASYRIVKMPEPYNDIADMVDELGSHAANEQLMALLEQTPRFDKGVNIPLHSAEFAMQRYRDSVRAGDRSVVELHRWLPGFASWHKRRVRGVARGEVIVLMADTGIGKSAALANILMAHPDKNALLFSLELPELELAERFTAMNHGLAADEVERRVKDGETFSTDGWGHIQICDEAGVSLERIREIVEQSRLITDRPADIVAIDYIGLVGGKAGSRYERVSQAAEGIKTLAKDLDAVVIVVSQIHRKGSDEAKEIGLHDAKDSGSIENSGQVVLGLWRDDDGEMVVRVNKGTKGGSALRIQCNFDPNSLVITEKSNREYLADDGLEP